jgi:ATPase family associated with various cellular activities (AAA)
VTIASRVVHTHAGSLILPSLYLCRDVGYGPPCWHRRDIKPVTYPRRRAVVQVNPPRLATGERAGDPLVELVQLGPDKIHHHALNDPARDQLSAVAVLSVKEEIRDYDRIVKAESAENRGTEPTDGGVAGAGEAVPAELPMPSPAVSVSVPLDQPLKGLNRLIGLDPVKADVRQLIDMAQAEQMRRRAGLPVSTFSHHLIFTGNPGTGKTTVARLLAQLYASIGILKTGQLIEASRSDLVAGYVGQTAIKTTEARSTAVGVARNTATERGAGAIAFETGTDTVPLHAELVEHPKWAILSPLIPGKPHRFGR